ncbi:PHP domain-containing protein [Candidatus Omnitrophota bacterium]
MKRHSAFVLIIFLLLSFTATACLRADDHQRISGIMHIQSTVSDGQFTIDEIVRKARDKGIAAVFITDHDMKRWSYGFLPLRNIFKNTVEEGSILSFGAKRYLELIERAREKYPDMVIIPGAECACFYYWDGSFIRKNMKLRAWHRHMLAVGLERPVSYENLPLISNGKSGYDQYHGDKWYKPYQELIDYVNDEGGMTFWAHPEAANSVKIGGILIHTLPYEKLLLDTEGYTGYGIFHEGYGKVGLPGGLWDAILTGYCEGRRKEPVWAIGETDYEGKRSESIDHVKNVFLVTEKSRSAVLDALKNGRFYVVVPSRECELILDDFSLREISGSGKAAMGATISGADKVALSVSVSSDKDTGKPARIMLVKDGEIYKIYNERLPFTVELEEAAPQSGRTAYYRIDASCQGSRLISNPIFWE